MIIITSFNTLVILAVQLLVAYFVFKIQDRENLLIISGGTMLVKVLIYLCNLILKNFIIALIGSHVITNFIINLGFYVLACLGLCIIYNTKGNLKLSKNALVIAIINTIIMYVIQC